MSANMESEVTLEEMLDAREKRAERQREYLKKNAGSVLCFMLNIPGPVKVSKEIEKVFTEGIERIQRQLKESYIPFVEYEIVRAKTGYEYYLGAECDPETLKQMMVEVEENGKLARLFDIDVFRKNGEKIDRQQIGRAPRKCLICEEDAHVCARNRTHSVDEMMKYIQKIIKQEL